MEWDEPRSKAGSPAILEQMSIAELEAHIAALTAEIERARLMIAAKRSHRGGADALFGSGGGSPGGPNG